MCRMSHKGQLPRLALANDMWIGNILFELVVLTMPERILITKHFPAVYIVKMFPKCKGATALNDGLQGNVSIYHLDIAEIADMVADNIMPRPIKILALIIGVTIMGPKNMPK
jgi:hypothetical protein